MSSRYSSLTRAELATVVPELLLIGQLIDRSGMAWCISAYGREEMAQIAIEEWSGSSPIYTRRMQRALGYVGSDIVTIFKGLQLDIGAPPQFMDFRFEVEDAAHGSFHLAHCGALMDVEPMGEDYVRSMCHDIEDPTFDATAVATNPRAQVRPVHRPPRPSADIETGRSPHCAWTVIIDDSHPEVTPLAPYYVIEKSRAASVVLADIDVSSEDDGRADYAGPLLSDLDFADFSHSALVRIADEVCLQMHLLNLSFVHAVRQRAADEGEVTRIATKQLVGIAGLAAERIQRALGLPATLEGALRTLELHPLLNPLAYVGGRVSGSTLSVEESDASADGAWISLCGPESVRPLQAIVSAIDPCLDVEVSGQSEEWVATIVRRDEARPELDEVAVTRFSSGASFAFEPRLSLPITPI